VRKRLLIEMGMGIDQHGQDPTNAARKAVKDAISRNYLTGLSEIAGLKHPSEMYVDVLIGVPFPHKVDPEAVLEALPYGHKTITVVEGGLLVQGGRVLPELGDASGEIIIANAAVTVSIEDREST